jgi:hypothetical protein
MRFCPFCSAENADESAVCASCGRRLPPLPPRRAGSKGQPTGVQLPPRNAPAAPAPQRKPPTMPPPIPSGAPPGSATSRPEPVGIKRESAPALPSPPAAPAVDDQWNNSGRVAQLRNAIAPGPAAERRDAPPPDPAGAGPARRKSDSKVPPPVPNSFARSSSSGGLSATIKAPVPDIAPFDQTEMETATALETADSMAPTVARTMSASLTPMAVARTKSASLPPEVASTLAETAPAVHVAPTRSAGPALEPPPTRIHRPEALADRPWTPQKVHSIPDIPEPGLVNAARYTYQFAVARWQRRGAIKTLGIEIKQDTEALDQVLGALGRAARGARVEGRVFSAENTAISAAEERVGSLTRESGEVDGRKAEENSKFVDVERERNAKLVEAERMVEEAQRELQHLEAQRRALRDKRKELDRRQKAFLKNADDHDRQAGAAPLGDQRQELRRTAEGHRKEAAALEPDKQDIDRRITALERPIGEVTARLDAAKAELDAAKRSLNDAREGHTHRLAELDAEQKRKSREVALAEAEIQRRLVTLGTLVNLNRIEDPQFAELYHRIDRLRGAITARTTEIEKLTAEREAYDRGTLVRGIATIGGAFVALIALIVILRAVL